MKLSSFLSVVLFISYVGTANNAQHGQYSHVKLLKTARLIESRMANSPPHVKKIDKYILDKIERMQNDKNLLKYDMNSIVRKYSDSVVRVDGAGRLKVLISLLPGTSHEILQDLEQDLRTKNVIVLGVYYPEPNIQWYPEITCRISYQDFKEIARDERIANISVTPDPIFYSGSFVTEGDSALFADVARLQRDIDGGKHNQVTVGVISSGIQGIQASIDSGELSLSRTSWLPDHQQFFGREGTAMMEIIHDIAPGANIVFGSAYAGDTTSHQMRVTVADLMNQGCDIIVDDIGWPGDPWFFDWQLAEYISFRVEYNDLIYISSAGNLGEKMWTGP